MIKAFRVAFFEWKKFFKDPWRIITFLFMLAFVLLAAYYVAYLWLGIANGGPNFENPPTQWDASIQAKFESQRDFWYSEYLIAIGEKEPVEGTITIILPAEYCLERLRYTETMLSNQIPSCVTGFSSFSSPAFPLTSWYKEYIYLPFFRMMLFQDVCYVFALVPMWIHVYFVCRYDASKKIDLLYSSVHISRKNLIAGRFIHSLTLFLATQCVLFAAGLVFCQDVQFLVYSGETWHAIPCALVYFQRWLEMGLGSFSIFFLLFALGTIIPSGKIYLAVGIIPTLGLVPLLSMIRTNLASPQPFPKVDAVPYANLICSDGFLDSMGMLKYYGPVILIVISIVILLPYLLRRKRYSLSVDAPHPLNSR